MTMVTVLPATGAAFSDARDDGRWLRVTWHGADGMFVLSIGATMHARLASN